MQFGVGDLFGRQVVAVGRGNVVKQSGEEAQASVVHGSDLSKQR